MKHDSNIHDGTLYCVGPLNLNRQTKQASTVMGTELILNTDEFAALDMLAVNEGKTVTFEPLYEAVWHVGNGSCSRGTALTMLEKLMEGLMKKINETGERLMWIEYKPEAGYAFRTRWQHNNQVQAAKDRENQSKL